MEDHLPANATPGAHLQNGRLDTDPVYMSQLATTEKSVQQTSAKKSDNRTHLHEQSAALNGIFR